MAGAAAAADGGERRVPSRRAVLAAGLGGPLLLLAAGCTDEPASSDPTGPGGTASAPPPSADDLLRAEAATEVADLAARYTAALGAAPRLARRLAPLALHVDEHLAALGGPPPGRSAPSAPPTPAADPRPALRAAEARAARRRQDQCLRAEDPALARLLASVGACSQAHVVLLGAGR